MKPSPVQLSTDTKVLINDWHALSEIIEKNTAYIKGTPLSETSSTTQGLLSDRQITDALQGPFQNFFKLKMTAYSAITKVRFMLVVTQDETFKNSKNTYPKETLQKTAITDLDKMQKNLDEQLNAHYQQWQELIARWQQQLIAGLEENDIPLSDIEIKEFQDQEPLSELYARFTDLNIEMKTPEIVDFDEYFHLKIHLAIHSSLSRRHKTHEHHEIHKISKKLKSLFSTITKEEKNLLTTQSQETSKVIEPIAKITQTFKPSSL